MHDEWQFNYWSFVRTYGMKPATLEEFFSGFVVMLERQELDNIE